MTLPLVLSKTGLGQDQQGADGLEECFDMLHEWLSKKEIVATDPCSPGVAKDVIFLLGNHWEFGKSTTQGIQSEYVHGNYLLIVTLASDLVRETDFRKATLI